MRRTNYEGLERIVSRRSSDRRIVVVKVMIEEKDKASFIRYMMTECVSGNMLLAYEKGIELNQGSLNSDGFLKTVFYNINRSEVIVRDNAGKASKKTAQSKTDVVDGEPARFTMLEDPCQTLLAFSTVAQATAVFQLNDQEAADILTCLMPGSYVFVFDND